MKLALAAHRATATVLGVGVVERLRRLRWLNVACIALVVVAVAAGCTAGESNTGRPSDEPAGRSEVPLLGPGTELTDGFTVPEGAELMIWPSVSGFRTGVEGVWRASMWVTGDPIALFNELAAQATEQGFIVIERGPDDCRILDDTSQYPWISCYADGFRVGDGQLSELVDFSVSVRGDRMPIAMLGVGSIPTETVSGLEFGDGPFQTRRFEPETAAEDAPDIELSPSDVGVGDRLVDAEWHRITLVDGSRLVASVAGPGDDCTAGMKAVVHVDGDPDDVFDAYVRQLGSRGDQLEEPAIGEPVPDVLGRRVRRAYGGGVDDYVSMTMVVGRESEPTRLLVEELCPD